MTTPPPAGWYPDPHGGPSPRWWNGAQWQLELPPPPSAALSTPRSGPPPLLIAVGGGVFLVALFASASGGISGFLSIVGLAGLIVGIIALVRGRVPSLALDSRRIGAAVLVAGLVVMAVGGAVGAATRPPVESASIPFMAGESAVADESDSPLAEETASAVPAEPEVVTFRDEVEEPIPFERVAVEDSSVASGTSVVTTTGVAGVLVVSYEVTTTDGEETARVRVGERVGIPPVTEVTTVGTRVDRPAAPPAASGGCDPNYSGCVPIASDVDCAGGSGDGPAYANGPVQVVGSDIYDLDRDGDGIACDS